MTPISPAPSAPDASPPSPWVVRWSGLVAPGGALDYMANGEMVAGHALLAFSPPHTVERWRAAQEVDPETIRPQLRRELAEARTRGHAQLTGMINTETTGVSVPVLDARGHALAALTVVVPRDSQEIPQFLMALQTAGRGISRAMQQH